MVIHQQMYIHSPVHMFIHTLVPMSIHMPLYTSLVLSNHVRIRTYTASPIHMPQTIRPYESYAIQAFLYRHMCTCLHFTRLHVGMSACFLVSMFACLHILPVLWPILRHRATEAEVHMALQRMYTSIHVCFSGWTCQHTCL